MPEELQEKLEDMLTSIVHDLTRTTTPAPDTTTPAGVAKAVSELAEEYNSLDTTETTIVNLENVKALSVDGGDGEVSVVDVHRTLGVVSRPEFT